MDKNLERGMTVSLKCQWPGELATTMQYHSEYPDASIEDIINGFYSCMIGLTWDPETVLKSMRDFTNEHLSSDEITED